MAEKKSYKIDQLGEWTGPIQNGKYTNYQCNGFASNERGSAGVIIQVGSEGMTQRMKVGESYIGKSIFQDQASGKWVINFMAADNPSLKAPEKGGYSRGGSDEHKRYFGGQNESFALSYAKDVVVAEIAAGLAEIDYADRAIEMAEKFLKFLNGADGNSSPTAQEKNDPDPTEEEEDNVPF